jgi:hypothetical protein
VSLVIPRSHPRGPWMGPRFAAADFNEDEQFFVHIIVGHPGAEHWPDMTARLMFPGPPDEMDAWVARTESGGAGTQAPPADAADAADAGQPPRWGAAG